MIGATRVWVVGEILTASNMNTFLSTLIEDLAGRNGPILLEDALEVVGGAGSYIRAPSLTTAERDGLTPSDGYFLYNSSDGVFNFRESGVWSVVGLHAASHAGGGADDIGGQPIVWTVDQSWNGAAIVFTGGVAVVGAEYSIQRDLDGTNKLHLNVPTGASLEFSINDIPRLVYSAGVLALQEATTISTTAGGVTFDPLDGIITLGNSTGTKNLRIQTTGAANNARMGVELPASGTGIAIVEFGQGAMNGTANNMSYQLIYDGTAGTFVFASKDIDGAATDGNIFSVIDGTQGITFLGDVILSKSGPTLSATTGNLHFDAAGGQVDYIRAFDGSLTIRVENTLDGSGDHAVFHAEVGGTIADPIIRLIITDSAEQWVLGIDNSISDRFAIANSTDLGTDPAFAIATDLKASFFEDLAITRNKTGTIALLIENLGTTSTDTALLTLKVSSSATVGDPKIAFDNQVVGGRWTIGLDNSSSDVFAISNADATLGGSDDALRCSTAQAVTFNDPATYTTFDYVCDRCKAHEARPFSCCGTVRWHDDIMALRHVVLEKDLRHMAALGVYTVEGDFDHPIWVGMNMQAAQHFTWAGMVQNRMRMDAQYEELDQRLQAIGA